MQFRGGRAAQESCGEQSRGRGRCVGDAPPLLPQASFTPLRELSAHRVVNVPVGLLCCLKEVPCLYGTYVPGRCARVWHEIGAQGCLQDEWVIIIIMR